MPVQVEKPTSERPVQLCLVLSRVDGAALGLIQDTRSGVGADAESASSGAWVALATAREM